MIIGRRQYRGTVGRDQLVSILEDDSAAERADCSRAAG